MSRILPPTPANLARAAACLRAGGLVALPTETVYGLAANARDDEAVARIFAAKGRPQDHPLIVHVADAEAALAWAGAWSPAAETLAARFWPGPLTLIVARGRDVSLAVTGGLPTVALRVPAHPVALAVLQAFGGGVAAPSANRFGAVSPTTAAHVAEGLGDAVDLVLDGGPCHVGVESTIVDVSQYDSGSGVAAVLRPGGVAVEALSEALGQRVAVRGEARHTEVRAPGQLPSHYAPEAQVRLVSEAELPAEAATWAAAGLSVAVLTASPEADWPPGVVPIPFPRDPEAAARRLYEALREVDRQGCHVVLGALPAERGLGLAVADRLRKAAGPRSPDGKSHP